MLCASNQRFFGLPSLHDEAQLNDGGHVKPRGGCWNRGLAPPRSAEPASELSLARHREELLPSLPFESRRNLAERQILEPSPGLTRRGKFASRFPFNPKSGDRFSWTPPVGDFGYGKIQRPQSGDSPDSLGSSGPLPFQGKLQKWRAMVFSENQKGRSSHNVSE